MYDNEWIFEILDDDLFLVEVEPKRDEQGNIVIILHISK